MVCKELGLSDKTLRNWVNAVGWTAPYLDLLGARMMITASYPIHASERLLAVASRDITLAQLSPSVLARLNWREAASASSSSTGADWRSMSVIPSSKARSTGVTRSRRRRRWSDRSSRGPCEGLRSGRGGVPLCLGQRSHRGRSRQSCASRQRGDGDGHGGNGHRVLAARIESTGWFVVLVDRKL